MTAEIFRKDDYFYLFDSFDNYFIGKKIKIIRKISIDSPCLLSNLSL